MQRDEADEVKAWFQAYNNKVRMEYGLAMALHGFSEDIIVAVQQDVARNMLVWLAPQT